MGDITMESFSVDMSVCLSVCVCVCVWCGVYVRERERQMRLVGGGVLKTLQLLALKMEGESMSQRVQEAPRS